MHELSIAIALVEVACEEAVRLGAARVDALHVRVGSLSGVLTEALTMSFEAAAAGTPIEGAQLHVEQTVGEQLELRALEIADP